MQYEAEPPWQTRGRCAGHEGDELVFFPRFRDSTVHETNRAFCRVCPVRLECFDHSMTWPEEWGTWGGVDHWTRREWIAERRPHRCSCGRTLDPEDMRTRTTTRRCSRCR